MDQLEPVIIQPEDPAHALTVTVMPRTLTMQLVSAEELMRYMVQYDEASTSSLNQTFLSMALSALVTLVFSWIASPPSGWALSAFTGAAIVFAFMSAFFALQTQRDRARLRRERERVRTLISQALHT